MKKHFTVTISDDSSPNDSNCANALIDKDMLLFQYWYLLFHLLFHLLRNKIKNK